MSNYKHPDEIGGGVLLFLIIIGVLYAYFVVYDWAGNFKTCDTKKYPLALYCFEETK